MPKKKSVKKAAGSFLEALDDISKFLDSVSSGQSKEHISWLYNYAIIRLYREFERLMLHAIVGAINNDTQTLSKKTGIRFPKHLTDEVCEYLIIGTGYFDFKGRDGLIKTLKRFLPDNYPLLTTIKKNKYSDSLERLSSLRNFAAHESSTSKKVALNAVDQERIASSGSWLKRQNRFEQLSQMMRKLAEEIEQLAPY
ncbi:hypothetical protein J7M28_10590 [bacterium]|nr:hypothetical protein [bacterium]